MPHDVSRLDAALARYPRVALQDGPTPIQKLSRLSQMSELNGCNLYVKREYCIYSTKPQRLPNTL